MIYLEEGKCFLCYVYGENSTTIEHLSADINKLICSLEQVVHFTVFLLADTKNLRI